MTPTAPQPPHISPPDVFDLALLPVLGTPAPERCDAARNRVNILAAAECLFARQGIEATSLDAIAAEAGVGKGTVFRRFGDRAGLMMALLSDREAAFQEQAIRGAPPIGPGAPAGERLLAFGPAMLAFVAQHGPLLRAAQTSAPGAWHGSSPYAFWHAHVRVLLQDAAPRVDAGPTADLLLSGLGAELVMHQLDDVGLTLERLADAWRGFVASIID